MCSTKLIILILVSCHKTTGSDTKIVFTDDGRDFQGDYCNRIIDGASGVCKLITYCPRELEIFRKYGIKPDVCEFKYNLPVVCCTESNLYFENNFVDHQHKGISLIKCQQYEQIDNTNRKIQNHQHTTHSTDLPHLAAIGWTSSYYTNWKCDGALISKNFVLASAGCLAASSVIPDLVKFLAQDQRRTSKNVGHFRITEIVNHPDYDQKLFYHDIALIRIYKNIRFEIDIRPACLWPSFNINSTTVMFLKWNQHFGSSTNVQKQYVNIFNIHTCEQYFVPSEHLNYGIDANQLCSRTEYSSTHSCRSNSGGILQIDYETNGRKQFFIIGVGSFKVSCDGLQIHAGVSSYIQWIEKIVWPNNN